MKSRRQFLEPIAAMALLIPLPGLAEDTRAKKTIKLNFGVINYTDHAIYDVALNGHGWGLAPPYFGSIGAMLLTPFEIGGPQKLTWRHGATGEIYTAKNQLFIREEDIPKGGIPAPFICIHVYPDFTGEITYTGGTTPLPTERGLELLKQRVDRIAP